jgi:hypothetical protein
LTLFFSVAEVNIVDTHGRKSIFSFRYQIYLSIILSLSIPGFASTLSHLFKTNIIHLFSSKLLLIIDKSCQTTHSKASITITTIEALVIALSVLIIDQFSIFLVQTLLSLLIQAVSISIKFCSLYINLVSILSLVVQAISFTITLSFQTRALIILDFPTFGLPIIASFIKLSSTSSSK